MLLKDEKVFYKLVLALAGAEAVEASQLGSIGGGGGEHDGLVAMCWEERHVLKHDGGIGEEMEIGIGGVGMKLCHGAEGVDVHHGHDRRQNLLETYGGKNVAIDDGHFH